MRAQKINMAKCINKHRRQSKKSKKRSNNPINKCAQKKQDGEKWLEINMNVWPVAIVAAMTAITIMCHHSETALQHRHPTPNAIVGIGDIQMLFLFFLCSPFERCSVVFLLHRRMRAHIDVKVNSDVHRSIRKFSSGIRQNTGNRNCRCELVF